jgi:CubicO group peptidase (beta-lactamase class C family)
MTREDFGVNCSNCYFVSALALRRLMLALILLLSPLGASAAPAAGALDFERLDATARLLPDLHSLLISHQGELVFEAYYNGRRAEQPANTKSASKSIISALVGIAIERGYIEGVDQPIVDFFPEYLALPEVPTAKHDITVGHLLSMQAGLASTSGSNYGGWVLSSNWVKAALDRPLVDEPGGRMIYSTGSTHLLSAIIERASGMNTRQFAQQYLASPMGFRLAYWSRDPQGIYFGGNDLEITPRQMVAFGQLYLNQGQYGGEQILAPQWVQESLQPHVLSPRGQGRHYGYGWALRDLAGLQVPLAWGYGGQMIYVVRELDMVIVMTSNSLPRQNRRNHLSSLYQLVENMILPPVSQALLAADRVSRLTEEEGS